jgi:hypothetical protein
MMASLEVDNLVVFTTSVHLKSEWIREILLQIQFLLVRLWHIYPFNYRPTWYMYIAHSITMVETLLDDKKKVIKLTAYC